MRRFLIAAVVAAGVLGACACGGYGSASPGGPTTSPTPPAGATIINIVGINGALSFAPNPGSVIAGQVVVGHNVDTVTHRVVFNDGELDTGNIAPGTFSVSRQLYEHGHQSRDDPPNPASSTHVDTYFRSATRG